MCVFFCSTTEPTPEPTPGPTPGPTPAPVDPVGNTPRNGDCEATEGIIGSKFADICEHTDNNGLGLINSFPDFGKTNEGPELSLGSIYDTFFNIEASEDGETVSYRMQNPFTSELDMYVQYEAPDTSETVVGKVGENVCVGTPSLDICGVADGDAKTGTSFESICIDPRNVNPNGEPYAIVSVYFVDHTYSFPFDHENGATVDECCHATNTDSASVARYTFYISCTCPGDFEVARRGLRGGAN